MFFVHMVPRPFVYSFEVRSGGLFFVHCMVGL